MVFLRIVIHFGKIKVDRDCGQLSISYMKAIDLIPSKFSLSILYTEA